MLPGNINILWASPACTAFSIASGNKYIRTVTKSYRKYDLIANNNFGRSAIKLIEKTIQLIFEINPDFYYIENPRGLLNHLPIMKEIPFKTSIYYSDYGAPSMKPTDIWHNNLSWINRIPKHKYSYNHLPHLMNSVKKSNRSVVPGQLINEILYYTLLNYETTTIHLQLEQQIRF